MSYSPLIEDGALSLTPEGLLRGAPDIQTQMTVTVGAYNCIYNDNVNSQLIPYLTGIPNGGWNLNAIKNIVVAAYTPRLIVQNIINNLTVAVIRQTINFITIKITAKDQENNPIHLTWNNAA